MEMLEKHRRMLSSRGVIKVPGGMEMRDGDEAGAGTRGDEGNKHPLWSENGAKIPLLRRNVNVTSLSKQQEGNFGSRTRKKRRRGKASGIEDRVTEDITEDSRENEIADQSSRRRNDPFSKSRPRSREARKSRAERRRRKKKDRKGRNRGGGRSPRQNDKRQDVERRSSKGERRTHDVPSFLDNLDLAEIGTDASSRRSMEDSSNVTGDRSTPLTEEIVDESATTSSSLRRHSTLEAATKRLTRTTPPRRGAYAADTVEREFSKQLEMEISKSASKDPSILDDGIFDGTPKKSTGRDAGESSEAVDDEDVVGAPSSGKIDFGNSRYDAERMLGYSRTKEDLPILDLENEVLERTLKDYNAYMKLKPGYDRRSPLPIPPRTTGSHPPRKPIINSNESDDEETGTEVTTQDDSTSGDLSCINGTFLPAPLSRHALIKYVKSSTPGHEYLEADYECVPGYRMASSASRLVCRSRQWLGQVPKCEIKQNPDRICAEASCEHDCNEINGLPVCSCYEGFRLLDGRKCVDINECLLNNGRGPCQDTCRNLMGGYKCSCEGLPNASLAADNHTCERDRHTGPCSVNNAGCSHTCLSTMGRVFCLCPDGFILEDDWKTCQGK
ncbi:signal cub and egf-like domain-containing protein 2 protein [Lasius niger]|uniref:Signal cub and egf-like domain-containing protein 2 protein n=1 Tax=Lasius niger TaxID=67767 RepID=A0A0J7KP44_LASNI|nr:signal cub and egf-like domain-containing protein 2 protein [Lasius niger]